MKIRFPHFYGLYRGAIRVFSSAKKIFILFIEWLRYRYCLYADKPYFGIILGASHFSHRRPQMQKCIELEIKNYVGDFFKILEVGSWAGASALLWAQALKEFGGGRKGLVLCVDPWKPYIGQESIGSLKPQKYERIERALKTGKIYKLFLHNIKAAGYADIIKPLRGDSDEILPTLQDGEFNFVYIDGSHRYSQVIEDLRNCKRLLPEGGILCGDDLELQRDQIDLQYAEENKGKDYILDRKSSKPFHPGVTLAVWEFFGGEVSSWEGFWAMRKTKSGWQKVILDL